MLQITSEDDLREELIPPRSYLILGNTKQFAVLISSSALAHLQNPSLGISEEVKPVFKAPWVVLCMQGKLLAA